jgi:hypothetical protein
VPAANGSMLLYSFTAEAVIHVWFALVGKLFDFTGGGYVQS